jgi:cardiolipin synthase
MISALLLIIEIAFLYATVAAFAEYSFVSAIVAVIISALAFIHLINSDANPEYKIPWMFIVLSIPFFGATLYVLFSSRHLTRAEGAKLCATIDAINELSDKEQSLKNLAALAERDKGAAGRALSILGDDPLASVFSDTRSEYFPLGEIMHGQMLRDIREAKRYILLEYFIVDDGYMWRSIHEALLEKVREGVRVKMLYDDIGCMTTLPQSFDKILRREGIECHRFSKLTPRLSTVHNNRDHRKILVIDGKIAYTGGVNIADEYINRASRFGHWKDGGIRIEGAAAIGFTRMFLSAEELATGSKCDRTYYLLPQNNGGAQDPLSTSERDAADGFYIPFGCGPAPIYKRSVGKRAIMNVINSAESYLYITTPYLIIDFDLTEALSNAAMRGVDVGIITPAIADKKIIKIMTKGSYKALIDAGVGIYEYAPGFIHEKTIVSDDTTAMIGTINLDYRSLVHHFECAVMLYHSPTVLSVRDQVAKTLGVCTPISADQARLGFFERIVKNLVRIFAPLL